MQHDQDLTATPTNSVDSIFPGMTRPAHCMNMALTADVRSGAVSVRTLDGVQETVKFPLPKGLRHD